MIINFGDRDTEKFANDGKVKFSGLDVNLADRRISALHAATSLEELGKLKSVGLHKLHGPLKDFWSLNLNGRWRLIFRFDAGDAYDVQITDTH